MPQARKPNQLAAHEWLTHEQLIGAVLPSIEFLRHEIFGREGVPFPTPSKAVKWIESAPPPKNPLSVKRKRDLDRTINDATGGLGFLGFHSPRVPYRKPQGGASVERGVAPGSLYASLGARARQISDATGWRAEEVVMWVLADREPAAVPRVNYRVNMRFTRLPTGGSLHRKTVALEVYNPEMNDAEWRRVRKGIRKEFRRDHKRSLPTQDHILYEVVQKYGDKAAHGETCAAHWEVIADECNHRSDNPIWFTGWRGPYMRWRRLCKKLGEIQEHSWGTSPAG